MQPSLLNPERKVISDSITFFARGNTEQMATIVTRFTMISTVHGRLFFGINLPWPHEVFIEVLALGGEACEQVNGIRDMTEAQSIRIFYVNSFWHQTPCINKRFALSACILSVRFLWVEKIFLCAGSCPLTSFNSFHLMLSKYWHGQPPFIQVST